MQSIVNIYLTLVFFVYIIFCSSIYLTIQDYSEKKFNKKVLLLSETFGKEVLNQLNQMKNNIDLTEKEIKYINRKLKMKVYEKVFNDTLILFNDDPLNSIYVKKYMEKFDSYIRILIKKYSKENGMKKIYITFLMGQYKVDKDYINEFLYNAIKTNSLYMRFNAINSISQIGNVACFIEALSYVSEVGGYLNNKIFIDIMDQFGGNIKEFNDRLAEYLGDFSEDIQCMIIDHFKNCNYVAVAEKLAYMLNSNDTNIEVIARIVKYFSSIKYPPVKEILIKLLDSEQWEYRALVAKALSNYYGLDTLEKLLISIMDQNWYVRFNSAMTLLDFELGDNLLYFVKYDKYATEILYYAMFVKNKVTYLEYLEETNKQVAVTTC